MFKAYSSKDVNDGMLQTFMKIAKAKKYIYIIVQDFLKIKGFKRTTFCGIFF